jgi:coenzyme F420-reducing hydrogenase delta subunit
MAVGPPGRTGRDQLASARAFAAAHAQLDERVVLVACSKGAGGLAARSEVDGAPVLAVGCAGNLHTSVVETLLRAGAAGVLVAACPPRDCTSREGAKWLAARLFEGREAELHERAPRERVRVVHAGAAEGRLVRDALAALRRDGTVLGRASLDGDLAAECSTARAEAAS